MPEPITSVTLAFTGASGMPYGLRLLECLLAADMRVHVVMSQAAQVVTAVEMDMPGTAQAMQLTDYVTQYSAAKPSLVSIYGLNQWSAPIASGSNCADAMVVCPCSSGSVAAIAQGSSNNLLERAADVMIKERKPLILVPRETPMSPILLQNLLQLAQIGVTILPACPGFYHKPTSVQELIDFVVARILDHLRVPHSLIMRWGRG